MSTLESEIDDLYRKPLNEFIPARSALAAGHKGEDGRRIKALKKPTLVPWAVNQVYWHARPIFDRVQASGADLRRTQIDALEGRKADVQAAAAAHRSAIGSAVERAMTLAKASQTNPDRDAVARTFEALSIASEPPEPLGRLTQPLQPGGFELLAGVEPMARAAEDRAPTKAVPDTRSSRDAAARGTKSTHRAGDDPEIVPAKSPKPAIDARAAAERAAAERARERARAAAARRHDAAIAKLEHEVARAKQQVAQARLAWDRATDQLTAAERQLSDARRPRPVV